MSETLRPCPFCGSKDVEIRVEAEHAAYMLCRNCDTQGPVAYAIQAPDFDFQSFEDMTAELWNARTYDDVMLDAADEIEGSADPCLQWLVRLLREEAGR